MRDQSVSTEVPQGHPDEFVSVKVVAGLLGVGAFTVRRLIRQKLLRALEPSQGYFRVRRRWVEEYIEEHATGGVA